MIELPQGVHHWPGYLDHQQQKVLLSLIREAVKQAPLFTPRMPRTGKPMSVRMTNLGSHGWVTDRESGYRYQTTHPQTGTSWPPMPEMLLNIWNELSNCSRPPQACLVNFYEAEAKMGMHQDRDEEDFDAPVLSLSLGDDCLFRVGGTQRGGKTVGFRLCSGDAMMLTGPARLAFHGVGRIYPDTSDLLKQGGRINLTLRRVTA
ncbi:MAG: alpha-ketoglutarate-dependent dioxygenase AlkB [Ahrensia sp.]|nr:alpha-ketoglutarate-dependent dioxygenase AlkB [Ahrensia sp.]